jgi:hypothetical protein
MMAGSAGAAFFGIEASSSATGRDTIFRRITAR